MFVIVGSVAVGRWLASLAQKNFAQTQTGPGSPAPRAVGIIGADPLLSTA
jgi:hypothetical protein